MTDLSHIFNGITDPRRSNAVRHDLHEMLMIALLTVISGGETCTDTVEYAEIKKKFLLEFMDLKHGTPSCDAFSDLFNSLNPVELGVVLSRLAQSWAEGLAAAYGDGVIAVDGKTLRRSFADASKRHPLHLVHAFASDTRLVLAQTAVDGKSNEITAIPALLKFLDIRGRTVTADAMHAQRTISEAVKDGGGEYILALKGNQGNLHKDVKRYMENPDNIENIQFSEMHKEKGHGRIETRRAAVCHDIDWLEKCLWPGLAAVGSVSSTREIKGKRSAETRYLIMSGKRDPERFLKGVREHWSAANSLHWVLDVTMNEDHLRNRTGPGPENLAVMRRLCLNLARVTEDKQTRQVRRKLKKAGWDHRYALKLISSAAMLPENRESQKR